MPAGRPSKFSAELAGKILTDLRRGLPIESAAEGNRITPRTLFDWIAKGAAGDDKFAEFSQDVKESRIVAERLLLERIAIGNPGWQGSAWILERTRREKYGQVKQQQEPTADELRIKEDARERMAKALRELGYQVTAPEVKNEGT